MADATYISGGNTHWAPSTTFAAGEPVPSTVDQFHFEIDNLYPASALGPDDYSIHLYSVLHEPEDQGDEPPDNDGDETGTFTYAGGAGAAATIPKGGTIESVVVKDDKGNVYFSLTGAFQDSGLADFWNTLQTSGAKAALDQLVGNNLTEQGSGQTDYVETYGQFGTYHLGGGNSFLDITYSNTTAYADGGSDTFIIDQSGLIGLQLHGGLADGTAAPGEVSTIDFNVAGTLTFQAIDGFTSFTFTAPGSGGQYNQFIYLHTDQLPGGTTPTFHVTGSAASHANEIVIVPTGGGAQHINLSNVTVSDFTARLDQAFWFYFAADKTNDTMIGAPHARNVFQVGSGNDRAIGGHLADVFIAGHGHDYFNGGGGIDVATYHAGISHYTVTKLGAHTYRVHDNRHGSPDGTDTLVNVEYLKFANATEFIGGNAPVITVGAGVHTHDLALAPTNHFELFA